MYCFSWFYMVAPHRLLVEIICYNSGEYYQVSLKTDEGGASVNKGLCRTTLCEADCTSSISLFLYLKKKIPLKRENFEITMESIKSLIKQFFCTNKFKDSIVFRLHERAKIRIEILPYLILSYMSFKMTVKSDNRRSKGPIVSCGVNYVWKKLFKNMQKTHGVTPGSYVLVLTSSW